MGKHITYEEYTYTLQHNPDYKLFVVSIQQIINSEYKSVGQIKREFELKFPDQTFDQYYFDSAASELEFAKDQSNVSITKFAEKTLEKRTVKQVRFGREKGFLVKGSSRDTPLNY